MILNADQELLEALELRPDKPHVVATVNGAVIAIRRSRTGRGEEGTLVAARSHPDAPDDAESLGEALEEAVDALVTIARSSGAQPFVTVPPEMPMPPGLRRISATWTAGPEWGQEEEPEAEPEPTPPNPGRGSKKKSKKRKKRR